MEVCSVGQTVRDPLTCPEHYTNFLIFAPHALMGKVKFYLKWTVTRRTRRSSRWNDFFMGSVMLLAAAGDVRILVGGGVIGAKRIAPHLWRMCFGLFIAAGSFFLGPSNRPLR
jgi:hypothetical protein